MAVLGTLVVRLQAQIAEFQADFKKATESTEKFQQEFQTSATKASAYGNLIADGVQFAVRAIGDLSRAVLENASNLVDLANKTGLTTDSIQEFQHVASQTGTTVEAFTNAAFKLGANLAGGSRSVVAAVRDLGLSFEELQRLSPDEKFLRIAEALRAIEDPQERARIGLVLFGREFRNIAPAIAEGYAKMAEGAIKASRAQLEAIDAAGDAWDRFQHKSLTFATSVAGNFVLGAEEMKRAGLSEFLKQLVINSGNVGDAFTAMAAKAAAAAQSIRKDINLPLEGSANRDFVKELEAARATVQGLSADTKKQIAAAQQLGASTDELTSRFGLSTAELKVLNSVTKDYTKTQSTAQRQQEEYAEVLKKIRAAQVPLTQSQMEQIDTLSRLGISHSDIAKALRISEIAVRNYDEANKQLANEGLRAVGDAVKFVEERIRETADAYERELGPALKAVADDISFVEQRINDSAELWEQSVSEGLQAVADEIKGVEERIFQDRPEAPDFFGANFGRDIGNALARGFASGDVRRAVSEAASRIGSEFGSLLAHKLTTGANAITGWLGGMISAALPVIGSLLGPLVDKIASVFDRNKGRDLVVSFAESFGGFDALHKRLGELGAAGEALWIKLTQGVGRNNPEQAKAVIAEVQAALDAFGTEAERAAKRLEGIGIAIDGINTKAALFIAPFEALSAKLKEGTITQEQFTQKLAEMGQRGQAEFERIGTFAAAAFAGMVRESGDAIGALQKLTPTLTILQQGIEKFGLSSTGTIDALLGMFSLINDAVTGPIFQAIQATGQIFTGLQQGGLLTADLFQTVATDIGASFRELEAKGGDVAKAMALSQPILQKLWEAQQIYGKVTDETTAKLLDQAEQQGIVGAHMKDVNQKILDVLIAIADVFGAKIPDSMRATTNAAAQAGADMERTFRQTRRTIEDEFRQASRNIEDTLGSIRPPEIKVPVKFEGEYVDLNLRVDRDGIPALQHGGVVRRPTLALVGEAGPEAVVPLSQLTTISSDPTSSTIILEFDGRTLAEIAVPHIPGVARRYVPA